MRLPDDIQYSDCYELGHEHHGWDGKCFYDGAEPTKDQDTINWLRSENAYLRGMIKAYEKFLKDKGFIKEEEEFERAADAMDDAHEYGKEKE